MAANFLILVRDCYLHCRTMEEKYGLQFCSWEQSSCKSSCQGFRFFSAIFIGPRFVEIQRFFYHGNVTKRLLLSIKLALILVLFEDLHKTKSEKWHFPYMAWLRVVTPPTSYLVTLATDCQLVKFSREKRAKSSIFFIWLGTVPWHLLPTSYIVTLTTDCHLESEIFARVMI